MTARLSSGRRRRSGDELTASALGLGLLARGSAAERAAAARLVVRRSRDGDEAARLLDVLGLVDASDLGPARTSGTAGEVAR